MSQTAAPPVQRARIMGQAGDYQGVLNILNDYLKEAPLDEDALFLMGAACFKLTLFSRARESWDKILKLNPGHAKSKSWLEKIPAAESSFLLDRARTLGQSGDFKSVMRTCNELISHYPNISEAHFLLGAACFKLKMYGRAKEAWNRVLELVPNHDKARRWMAKLPSDMASDTVQVAPERPSYAPSSDTGLISIRHRETGEVLRSVKGENLESADLAGADLRGAELSKANLAHANLYAADLTRAHLPETDLTDANLRSAVLTEVNLAGSMLREANLVSSFLRGATISDANLSEADLTRAILSNANLEGSNLKSADLIDADLTRAVLTDANLSNANMEGCSLASSFLRSANLSGANMAGADLTRVNLSNANLEGTNLEGAKMTGAFLRAANLTNANLAGADLTRANLSSVNLEGANLSGANFTDADLGGALLIGANIADTIFSGADLNGADLTRTNLEGSNLLMMRAEHTERIPVARKSNGEHAPVQDEPAADSIVI